MDCTYKIILLVLQKPVANLQYLERLWMSEARMIRVEVL